MESSSSTQLPACARGIMATILILASSVEAHSSDSRVQSFIITGESRDTITASLPQRKAKCTFDYVAGQPVHENKPVAENTRIKVEDVLQRLSGQCASGQSGYWTYEACLGGNIRQYHGADVYLLGRFSGVEGRILRYDHGLPCDPPANPQERKVDVSLACSDQMGLQLISEPSTCAYTMTLVTPEVCADSSFPKLMATPGGGAGTKPPDDGHEDWILQIRETANGQVVCSAFSTEQKLAGSLLSFSSFSLKIDGDDSSSDAIHYLSAKARSMGRVPLTESEMSVGSNAITHGQDFHGKLGYVEVIGTMGNVEKNAEVRASAEDKKGWFT